MATSNNEFCTRDGAIRLAAKIYEYWQSQGYTVHTTVEQMKNVSFSKGLNVDVWVVRSNLINGVPPEQVRGLKPHKQEVSYND